MIYIVTEGRIASSLHDLLCRAGGDYGPVSRNCDSGRKNAEDVLVAAVDGYGHELLEGWEQAARRW